MTSPRRLKTLWLTLMLFVVGVLLLTTVHPAPAAGDAEHKQMLAAARSFVKANSVSGITFDLKLVKQVGNYALMEVIPTGAWVKKTDPAELILQKISGKWVGLVMGTDLLDWQRKVPELFK